PHLVRASGCGAAEIEAAWRVQRCRVLFIKAAAHGSGEAQSGAAQQTGAPHGGAQRRAGPPQSRRAQAPLRLTPIIASLTAQASPATCKYVASRRAVSTAI